MTGKEFDLGSCPFNLAKYAKDDVTTEKLYVNGSNDMYIEIQVTSKPNDGVTKPKKEQSTNKPIINQS